MVHLNFQAVIQDFLQRCNLTVQDIFSEYNHNEYECPVCSIQSYAGTNLNQREQRVKIGKNGVTGQVVLPEQEAADVI